VTVELKPGLRLRSVVDEVEVIVVRAPASPVDLRCGGQPMVALDAGGDRAVAVAGFDGGTQLGKRYADDAQAIEVLCTKAGACSLSIGDVKLQVKPAKPLPASD